MNLLRVISTMNPAYGGPCEGIRNSIPELEKLGVHNEVVSSDKFDAPFLGADPFIIHTPGAGKGPWNYNHALITWLTQNMRRFDVVIVHGLWLFHTYAVWKAAQKMKERRPKIFIMPHGMLDPYFQIAAGRKLKAIRNNIYWKLIESKVINDADGVLFTCQQELLLAREPFKSYSPKQEINAGYGIAAPPIFTKSMKGAFLEKCPAIRNRPYFLFLSRVHEKKGVDILIKAYKKFRLSIAGDAGTLPDLVIAGPGLETPYGRKMQALALNERGESQNIIFAGMLTGEAKWGAFYECEAFLLPSHQENFGIALAEALACSKPVLISNKVNIWREVHSYGGGLVLENTEDSIFQAFEIWSSLTDTEKGLMSQQAFNCYKENFSIGDSAQRLFQSIQTSINIPVKV